MPDYDRLSEFLVGQPAEAESVTLSFAELERLVGGSLPSSAYRHRAWWSNDRSHSHARRWLHAGWSVSSVNLVGSTVVFARPEGAAHRNRLEIQRFLRDDRVAEPAERNPRGAGGLGLKRQVGGHDFAYVSDVEVARNPDGSVFTHRPQARYAGAGRARIHKYGEGDFCKIHIRNAPEAGGVYALFVGDELAYIGEAADLARRWYAYGQISPRKCYKGGQETNCRLNKLVLSIARAGRPMTLWFEATSRRKEIEADLRRRLRPPWNAV